MIRWKQNDNEKRETTMVMPVDLVLIRHGQSEANIVHEESMRNPEYVVPADFSKTHDSLKRLSPLGHEQAKAAGEWLRNNNLTDFDQYFVSPHKRACQTAGLLNIDGRWKKDDRWRERDWGEYSIVDRPTREALYGASTFLKTTSEWYWKPAGGESLATGVRLRFDSILDGLHRDTPSKSLTSSVVVVTHAEMIRVSQFVLEALTPEIWNQQEAAGSYRLANCQIVQYSRRNPYTGEISPRISWRRSVCPWDNSLSWNNGDWVPMDTHVKEFTDAELLAD